MPYYWKVNDPTVPLHPLPFNNHTLFCLMAPFDYINFHVCVHARSGAQTTII